MNAYPQGWVAARETMVRQQIERRGVTDRAVLRAMRTVPRHLFVPFAWRDQAYMDQPLPLRDGQTISQPYIVALMTAWAQLPPEGQALEIGTGSGYQAAILSRICRRVFTIEIIPVLAAAAAQRFQALGYDNIECRVGDGGAGWVEKAPFDAVIVTAAPEHIPAHLTEQLRSGGRLVMPIGASNATQTLQQLVRRPDGRLETRRTRPVRFVPMTGAVARSEG